MTTKYSSYKQQGVSRHFLSHLKCAGNFPLPVAVQKLMYQHRYMSFIFNLKFSIK
jgi:hypothetical protein